MSSGLLLKVCRLICPAIDVAIHADQIADEIVTVSSKNSEMLRRRASHVHVSLSSTNARRAFTFTPLWNSFLLFFLFFFVVSVELFLFVPWTVFVTSFDWFWWSPSHLEIKASWTFNNNERRFFDHEKTCDGNHHKSWNYSNASLKISIFPIDCFRDFEGSLQGWQGSMFDALNFSIINH